MYDKRKRLFRTNVKEEVSYWENRKRKASERKRKKQIEGW